MEIFKSKIDTGAERTEVLHEKLHNSHTSTEAVVIFPTKNMMNAWDM
jgi:hypothetical protein